jgi:hypothetical protein
MNFQLSSEARQWQEKLRAFVDRERDIQAAIAANR